MDSPTKTRRPAVGFLAAWAALAQEEPALVLRPIPLPRPVPINRPIVVPVPLYLGDVPAGLYVDTPNEPTW